MDDSNTVKMTNFASITYIYTLTLFYEGRAKAKIFSRNVLDFSMIFINGYGIFWSDESTVHYCIFFNSCVDSEVNFV